MGPWPRPWILFLCVVVDDLFDVGVLLNLIKRKFKIENEIKIKIKRI